MGLSDEILGLGFDAKGLDYRWYAVEIVKDNLDGTVSVKVVKTGEVWKRVHTLALRISKKLSKDKRHAKDKTLKRIQKKYEITSEVDLLENEEENEVKEHKDKKIVKKNEIKPCKIENVSKKDGLPRSLSSKLRNQLKSNQNKFRQKKILRTLSEKLKNDIKSNVKEDPTLSKTKKTVVSATKSLETRLIPRTISAELRSQLKNNVKLEPVKKDEKKNTGKSCNSKINFRGSGFILLQENGLPKLKKMNSLYRRQNRVFGETPQKRKKVVTAPVTKVEKNGTSVEATKIDNKLQSERISLIPERRVNSYKAPRSKFQEMVKKGKTRQVRRKNDPSQNLTLTPTPKEISEPKTFKQNPFLLADKKSKKKSVRKSKVKKVKKVGIKKNIKDVKKVKNVQIKRVAATKREHKRSADFKKPRVGLADTWGVGSFVEILTDKQWKSGTIVNLQDKGNDEMVVVDMGNHRASVCITNIRPVVCIE